MILQFRAELAETVAIQYNFILWNRSQNESKQVTDSHAGLG